MSINQVFFSRKMRVILAAFLGLVISKQVFAWSWQIELVNNRDVPLNYQFKQKNSGNAWADDGSKNRGVIEANSNIRFSLTTGGTFNKTTDGILTISNSENLVCNIRYYQESIYSAHNLSQWKLTGNDNSPQCDNIFLSSTEASNDGWNPFDLVFNAVKFPRLTRGQTQCSGSDNCAIINPDQYDTSWAVKNIERQTHMADDEALNIGQVFGTHNSIISRKYTIGSFMTNMSYADPNHYISVTEQLNLGIRQLEYDFLRDGNSFQVCHFKSEDDSLSGFAELFLCKGNVGLSATLNELNNWIETHPNELIYLYFDNTEPWNTNKLSAFESTLRNTLNDKILTKSDIQNNALDVNRMTRNEITKTLKKNVILYAHNRDAVFAGSNYIFENVVGNPHTQLHDDHNISDFSEIKARCGAEKSCVIDALFPTDESFMSLHALREDRTHLQQEKGSHKNTSVYLTNGKLKDALRYPINIFDFDKLSLNDARLYSAVWSFKFPYPIDEDKGGADIAFIDPYNGKFSNQKLSIEFNKFGILCYNPSTHQWLVEQNQFENMYDDSANFKVAAQNTCKTHENFVFSTPVSGYQLDEVTKSGLIRRATLINYTRDESGDWTANNHQTLNFPSR